MNDVSDHEATMRFLYGYVAQKNISHPAQHSSCVFVLAINKNFIKVPKSLFIQSHMKSFKQVSV